MNRINNRTAYKMMVNIQLFCQADKQRYLAESGAIPGIQLSLFKCANYSQPLF